VAETTATSRQARKWYNDDGEGGSRVSPTVFRVKDYRFFFFSREETRAHVHISSPEGEAKFWIEPEVELVLSKGLSARQVDEISSIVRDRKDEIRAAWQEHFKG
jgi:hypothetical protein